MLCPDKFQVFPILEVAKLVLQQKMRMRESGSSSHGLGQVYCQVVQNKGFYAVGQTQDLGPLSPDE